MLISAFAFGGNPEKAVKKAFKEADIYVSPAILKEYREVPLALEAEGKINHPQFKSLISGIAAFVARARLIHPVKKVRICRDAKDDMLLECCLQAEAGFLITGDKDLLDLKDLPFNLKIITVSEFLELI